MVLTGLKFLLCTLYHNFKTPTKLEPICFILGSQPWKGFPSQRLGDRATVTGPVAGQAGFDTSVCC